MRYRKYCLKHYICDFLNNNKKTKNRIQCQQIGKQVLMSISRGQSKCLLISLQFLPSQGDFVQNLQANLKILVLNLSSSNNKVDKLLKKCTCRSWFQPKRLYEIYILPRYMGNNKYNYPGARCWNLKVSERVYKNPGTYSYLQIRIYVSIHVCTNFSCMYSLL